MKTLFPLPRWILVIAAGVAIPLSGLAASDTGTRSFNIPEGPAEAALLEFSNQAGIQVLFQSDRLTEPYDRDYRSHTGECDSTDRWWS